MLPSPSATVRYMVSALVWWRLWAAAVEGQPCLSAASLGGVPGATTLAAALMLMSLARSWSGGGVSFRLGSGLGVG